MSAVAAGVHSQSSSDMGGNDVHVGSAPLDEPATARHDGQTEQDVPGPSCLSAVCVCGTSAVLLLCAAPAAVIATLLAPLPFFVFALVTRNHTYSSTPSVSSAAACSDGTLSMPVSRSITLRSTHSPSPTLPSSTRSASSRTPLSSSLSFVIALNIAKSNLALSFSFSDDLRRHEQRGNVWQPGRQPFLFNLG